MLACGSNCCLQRLQVCVGEAIGRNPLDDPNEASKASRPTNRSSSTTHTYHIDTSTDLHQRRGRDGLVQVPLQTLHPPIRVCSVCVGDEWQVDRVVN